MNQSHETTLIEAEVEDLRGQFDRSRLRKQKEKALRMLEEEKSKVAKLEVAKFIMAGLIR